MAITKKARAQINRKRLHITRDQIIHIRRHEHLRPKVNLHTRKTKGRPKKLLPAVRHSDDFIKIAKFFIDPFMLEQNPNRLEHNVLNLFSVQYREVVLGLSKYAFTMPGYVWNNEQPTDLRAPTTLEAKVLPGVPLIVRIDENMPNRIDIERTDRNVVFSLTRSEYVVIYRYIQEVTGCNELLEPPTLLAK